MSEPHFDGRILKKIEALQLPHPYDFVLNSSGALAERGVIPVEEVGDIDGSTCETNHEYLRRALGWQTIRKIIGYSAAEAPIYVRVTHDPEELFDVHYRDFSQFDYKRTGNGRIMLDEQKACSQQDPNTGVWVATVDYVERTKRETGRDKDMRRLAAIERFQKGK